MILPADNKATATAKTVDIYPTATGTRSVIVNVFETIEDLVAWHKETGVKLDLL